MKRDDFTDWSDDNDLDTVFNTLADPDRRYLVRIVSERAPTTLTPEDLAASLLARTHESAQAVPDMRRKQALTSLYHVHLPKLSDAGLIEWDQDNDTIDRGDHPVYQTDIVDKILEHDQPEDSDPPDRLLQALADSRRRDVLSLLKKHDEPTDTETIARNLIANDRDDGPSTVSEDAVQELLVDLRHQHLPRLAEAGVIRYDRDQGTVVLKEHPLLSSLWMQ